MFDNSFEWAVTPRNAEDRTMIKRLIAGIRPDGGTQIAPALTEAYKRVLPMPATYKHIVLLTDGISEEGDSFDLAAQRRQPRKVTISTVGLGQDVNRCYLEKIALAGRRQILLSQRSRRPGTDPAARRAGTHRLDRGGKTDAPGRSDQASRNSGWSGHGQGAAAHGYVRFIPKPSAEMILRIDRKEPLLERWQYGLGRAAVFTSDAKARWAADWIGWNGYDKFWTNLCRDLLPRAQAGEATLEFDSANGDLVADVPPGARRSRSPRTRPGDFRVRTGRISEADRQ